MLRVFTAIIVLTAVVLAETMIRPAQAQLFPFQRNKAEPIDPARALLEGYRAYQSGDYPAAIGRLELAATNFPPAGDYAFYYLAAAQAANGDSLGAAGNYRRLTETYPQSVLADSALLEYARLELKVGNLLTAMINARQLANRTGNPTIEQPARLIIAQAAYGLNDFSAAFAEAQRIREKYPRGASDAEARRLARVILSSRPSLAGTSTLQYRLNEATLLVHEGQFGAAREELHAVLNSGPPPAARAELYWLLAEASRSDEAENRSMLQRYLAVAPRGSHAPAALDQIAHLYWRVGDTSTARRYFTRIAVRFPNTERASNAMFEIGRTYEDDADLTAARREYLRLLRRFTNGDEVEMARFRAPFMLYMQGRYAAAAIAFADAKRGAAGADWAMFAYWEARSLELSGQKQEAKALLGDVARDTRSNYYPALASRRVGVAPEQVAAAAIGDPIAGAIPQASGAAGFHLARIAAFRELGLRGLEPPELSALAHDQDPAVRNWVLAEMQAAGAWYDAIQLANSMLVRGEIYPSIAERVRYPRGFWELVSVQAQHNGLDPWLVAALIRQESLYNPDARSVSDARGLMQLLPTTAEHWAPAAGVDRHPLDLFSPETSVRIGTTYLKGLFEMFDGNEFRAVAAYNGGEHAVAGWVAKYPGDNDQWVENIGYKETRDYVKKVIGGSHEYRLLYASPPAAATSHTMLRSPG
jgi:soluble lytic murein transglycosylase